jgi:O-antigen/teichoic acid export membrane protein
MQSEQLKSKTLSSLVYKLFERGGSAVVQLVVQIVMARLLTPDDFGALAIILVFVNLGNVVVQSGLNTALVRASDADERDCSTVYWLSLAISIVLYVVVFLAAPLVSNFYNMPCLIWPLRILAFILIINHIMQCKLLGFSGT